MTKLTKLIDWLDELIFDENRDERVLASVWENLKSEIEEKEKMKQ